MPAYRYQKGGKTMWYAKVNFQDTEGINRQHCKRGFKTRKDAEAYEAEYKAALKLCPQKGVQSLSEVLQSILDAHNISAPTAVTEPVQEPQKQRTFQEMSLTSTGLQRTPEGSQRAPERRKSTC